MKCEHSNNCFYHIILFLENHCFYFSAKKEYLGFQASQKWEELPVVGGQKRMYHLSLSGPRFSFSGPLV